MKISTLYIRSVNLYRICRDIQKNNHKNSDKLSPTSLIDGRADDYCTDENREHGHVHDVLFDQKLELATEGRGHII
ncbi:MAG: hypothetical protein WBQ25_19640 [Nitrososphaeraceae archaeon]